MAKVLVIPDIHLKPWMFKKADKLMSSGKFDISVILGDIPDDWGQKYNDILYKETFAAVISYIQKYPETLFCYGNHEMAYVWDEYASGKSYPMNEIVLSGLNNIEQILGKNKCRFVHKVDNAIFSHAGIMSRFIDRYIPDNRVMNEEREMRTIDIINKMRRKDLWIDDSPLWARVLDENYDICFENCLQVTGHTPVKTIVKKSNIIIVDLFSRYSNGAPIGIERFVCVDTISKTYEIVEE